MGGPSARRALHSQDLFRAEKEPGINREVTLRFLTTLGIFQGNPYAYLPLSVQAESGTRMCTARTRNTLVTSLQAAPATHHQKRGRAR